MSFVKELEKQTNRTYTENGAIALRSTGDALVDLFSILGAMRPRTEAEIEAKFEMAYAINPELVTKMVFYARDAREGLGERRTGRILLRCLAKKNPDVVRKNIELIPFFGRWDDIFCLFDTACEANMIALIKRTLAVDADALSRGENVSLLAKWMPSINTSSYETVRLAKRLVRALGMTDKQYRQTLSALRKAIDIVERHMSAKDWENIYFAGVPANAMNRYSRVFERRSIAFKKYLEDLKAGKTKVNAGVLYPYDIVKKFMVGAGQNKTILQEQWNALPNYVDGGKGVLVVADVSGSMTWDNFTSMATSVGLATYFAERNEGAFANMYMTFSERPTLIKLDRNMPIDRKVRYVMHTDVGYNTNLEAVFDAVLRAAVKSNCPKDEMPSSIVVITDMEIDELSGRGNVTFLDEMQARFNAAGFELPNLVFWNVRSRHDTFHASFDDARVQMVSGHSASTFKLLMDSFNMTPYECMMKALNSPRYEMIEF